LENAEIVDPKNQQGLKRVFFGAQVTYVREDANGNDVEVSVQLVGEDEADFSQGKINWQSPVGKALLKAEVGDIRRVRVDGEISEIAVLEVKYII